MLKNSLYEIWLIFLHTLFLLLSSICIFQLDSGIEVKKKTWTSSMFLIQLVKYLLS